MDAKSAFQQVKLTESSSYYITFNTSFVRFRWLRMPFGISSAPEVWQRNMKERIEGLRGIQVIADDSLVCGFEDTVAQAIKDHDQNLTAFPQRCRKLNLTLKPQKVNLWDILLTADSIITDPNKVRAIKDMPTPTDYRSHLTDFLEWLTISQSSFQTYRVYLSRCVVLRLKMLSGVGFWFMMKLSRISKVLFARPRY